MPDYRQHLALSHTNLGILLAGLGQGAAAEEQFRKGLAIREKLAADFPAVPAYRQDLAASHNNLGVLLAGLGQGAAAAEQYRKGLAINEKLAADFPTMPDYRRDLATGHDALGSPARGSRPGCGSGGAVPQGAWRSGPPPPQKLGRRLPRRARRIARTWPASHNNLGNLLADLGQRDAAAGRSSPQGPGDPGEAVRRVPRRARVSSGTGPEPQQPGDLTRRSRPASGGGGAGSAGALAIREKLAAAIPAVPAYRQDLAWSHNSLGNLLGGLGQRAAAEEQIRKSLAIREKLAADFSAVPAYRQDLAWSHNSLGNLLGGLGQRAAAEKQYRKALALREKLAADPPPPPPPPSPPSPSTARTWPGATTTWASYSPISASVRQAEKQYRKGLAIWEKLAADFPAVPAYRSDLAWSHKNLGILLGGLGQRAAAEEQYPPRALAIEEKLAADFPAVPAYRSDLAWSHNSLGNLLGGLGQGAAAEEQYRKSLAMQEKLAAEFPAVPAYQVDLGGSYCNFGELIRNGGDPAASLKWFGQAIDCLQAVLDKEPRDVTAKQFLRNSHWGRAKAHDRLQKFAEAVKDWDRVIALSPPAEQLIFRASRATSRLQAGMVAEAVAEVAELTKTPFWPVGQWYNFACVYSVASGKIADKKREYADRAMELLRVAVKAGWKDAEHMKTDTDLDPLRDRDDFKKLIADFEKRFPPPKLVGPVHEIGQGLELRGQLDKQTPTLVYQVKLAAGKTYVIDLVSPDQKALDPYLVLSDATGKKLAEDDDSGGGLNARITFRAAQAGTYRIHATLIPKPKASGPFTHSTVARTGEGTEKGRREK